MIRQPNSILGNEKLLVTMGKKAEIFGFYYPRRDFAQHVEESQACIYDGKELIWSNAREWTSEQKYIENTNIVSTELKHSNGLKMDILDFIHPELPVLVRKYRISSQRKFNGKFFYYSNLQVGEMKKKNSAFCDHDSGLLAQYWKSYYVGISSAPIFKEWQIGKAMDTIWWTNAKLDMEDGGLQKNNEDIGNLNCAVGWDLNIDVSKPAEFTVFIGAASRRPTLYRKMRQVQKENFDDIYDETQEKWVKWLSRKELLELPDYIGFEKFKQDLQMAFDRSLLTLSILNDPGRGSFVASPEFDHEFEMSGGYGYCWNRDSAEIVTSLLKAGYPEYCSRFFKWCKATQMHDGSWFQRYWLDGNKAPSWGNFSFSTQIDETGSTIFSMDRYYRTLQHPVKEEYLDSIWATVLSAAEYLMRRTADGVHDPCICLWETHLGIFTYTNAAIYAGLLSAANMAKDYNEKGLADRWTERAEFIKKTTIERFWLDEGYFARGMTNGNLDTAIDASIIGTFVPFGLLCPDVPEEKEMIKSIIKNIEQQLRVPVNDHFGIKRYVNDNYIEGNPWIVTTLWLSKAMLEMASGIDPNVGDAENKEHRELTHNALKYIQWSLKGTTGAGMLPEQVNKYTGRPAWAIPLCWSCALMLDNVLLLDKIQKNLKISKEARSTGSTNEIFPI
ncbi:glycoside hydrolase family 15 protein [Methanolobus bombayensis]|uniref:glycoside hydrolase family 15 protein n=1 Tax=Methanolobus bombayensis TaxID=38023 RepID=UPI001AE92034|nr:glycoside hydrolase family 15 protein [Methanolobus bombayensis]MBP1910628.1 oligosaccharide amylase [Methanolobus bombayensis]